MESEGGGGGLVLGGGSRLVGRAGGGGGSSESTMTNSWGCGLFIVEALREVVLGTGGASLAEDFLEVGAAEIWPLALRF